VLFDLTCYVNFDIMHPSSVNTDKVLKEENTMRMQRLELLNKFYQEAELNGCKELAKELITLGANYHKRKGDSTIALMNAAKSGDLETVKRLSKEDVNLIDEYNKTALMHASENGQLDVVKYLLSQKADVFMKAGYFEHHALKLAAEKGHLEVAKELLVKISSKKVFWPISEALEVAIANGHTKIANMLEEKLETVSCEAIQNAVDNNDIEMVKKLISKIKNLDFPTGFNGHYTLLGLAAKAGFIEIVEILLENGASVEKSYQYGASPLFFAAENGHTEIVDLLLNKYGAHPNVYESDAIIQHTPLTAAAQNNHPEIVKMLAEKGADLNAFSTGVRETALMWAVEKDAEDAVRELIAAGADVNLKSRSGYQGTALTKAKSENIKKMLRDAGGICDYS